MSLIAEAEKWAEKGGDCAEEQRNGIKCMVQAAKLLANECIVGLLDQAHKSWDGYADERTEVERARDDIEAPGSVVWEKQATRLQELILSWTKEKLDDLEERNIISWKERYPADHYIEMMVSPRPIPVYT